MMQLKQQEKAIKKRGEGGRKEGSTLVEDNAAPDDRKDEGDGEKTLVPASKIDQTDNEEVIDHNLDKSESTEVSNLFEQEGIEDGYEIEEAYKIIEVIGQGNEKVSLFRNLEEKGDGEEEGEDDDATQHQPLDVL
jgi:hypothetical protein